MHAGISTILLIIPAQAALSRNIVSLRAAAALRTDERVRLTGELLEGSLSVKMLCWELPFQRSLLRIRGLEVAQMRKLLLIEAAGMAMMFFCTPLASFVTFAVAVASGTRLLFFCNIVCNLRILGAALLAIAPENLRPRGCTDAQDDVLLHPPHVVCDLCCGSCQRYAPALLLQYNMPSEGFLLMLAAGIAIMFFCTPCASYGLQSAHAMDHPMAPGFLQLIRSGVL